MHGAAAARKRKQRSSENPGRLLLPLLRFPLLPPHSHTIVLHWHTHMQIISMVQRNIGPTTSGLEVPEPAAVQGGGSFASYAQYCALMAACWRRDPAARPRFDEIVVQLRCVGYVCVCVWRVMGTCSIKYGVDYCTKSV